MSNLPRVVNIAANSPADIAGIQIGDELQSINGLSPRDIIQYQMMVDEPEIELEVLRGGVSFTIEIDKGDDEPLGIEVHSALFDQIRTCDNHCEFCFIYQLPPGLRKSLYTKDDDYRLSFLYGNFTTLTRFTELDLERVVTEKLSPLYVSIHATDPLTRSRMLRNKRGGVSLRWLKILLKHGIDIHGQLVICPGINDGNVLDATLAGIFDEFSELASVAVVPLGISKYSKEKEMRFHTTEEANTVINIVHGWQEIFLKHLGKRMVFASDEYYLLAQREFPPAQTYEGFKMHEDGIGMARAFELELSGKVDSGIGVQSGFFASVDAPAQGYRAPRVDEQQTQQRIIQENVQGSIQENIIQGGGNVKFLARKSAPIGIITGEYGAQVLKPLIEDLVKETGKNVRILPVKNEFFGGNIGVTGLIVGTDIAKVLANEPLGHRYLLPDVCLSGGRFLDGTTPQDLPLPVEIVPTDGTSLRKAILKK